MHKVLVAEHNAVLRQVLVSCLDDLNLQVSWLSAKNDLFAQLNSQVKILLLDQSYLTGPDDKTLEKIAKDIPLSSVILLCHESHIERRNAWQSCGFGEILFKPFSIEDLEVACFKVAPTLLQRDNKEPQSDPDFISLANLPSAKRNAQMKKALSLIDNLSQSDTTIILDGESGVGKEIFAKYIHFLSKRKIAPFVGINCASVPTNLLESELFGSEKGSYTGSTNRRLGKFELAQNGTILLDEISEMDLALQAKLLRVIQEKELYRLGGEESVKLDVRVIAATNRDLREWVQKGQFREDLYYRLNVISIHIPPLRDRKEDIPVLSRHILKKINKENPHLELTLSMNALEALCRYDWPGNIRELENILTRTAYLTKGNIIDQIQFDIKTDQHESNHFFEGTLDDVERIMIRKALEKHNGNRIKASRQLGISVRTLRNKLRQYRDEQKLVNDSDVNVSDEVLSVPDITM